MRNRLNLIFLPATEPDDATFGAIPDSLPGFPDVTARQLTYPRQVWYNAAIQADAIKQIRAWDVAPVVLIGFSKSGLGAWNIARTIPELVSGTIIFDAPVARQQLPPWETQSFYADDKAWQADLPLRTVHQFTRVMPDSHRLVLISGAYFHTEMHVLSQALLQAGCKHVFLDRPDMKHHWNSGWIEEALGICQDNLRECRLEPDPELTTAHDAAAMRETRHGTVDHFSGENSGTGGL